MKVVHAIYVLLKTEEVKRKEGKEWLGWNKERVEQNQIYVCSPVLLVNEKKNIRVMNNKKGKRFMKY